MITKEQANQMIPEEVMRVDPAEELEDQETKHILICKGLFHLAVRDKVEMLIGEEGKIFFKGKGNNEASQKTGIS